MTKRYDRFGDEALKDSWPVYVLAQDYDAIDDLLSETENQRYFWKRLAEDREAQLVEAVREVKWLRDLLTRAIASHSTYCGCESCEYVKVGPPPPPESFTASDRENERV